MKIRIKSRAAKVTKPITNVKIDKRGTEMEDTNMATNILKSN